MLSGVEMEKSTWLPGLDQWFRASVTPDAIPAYYRGGFIVPRRERPRRSTVAQVGLGWACGPVGQEGKG